MRLPLLVKVQKIISPEALGLEVETRATGVLKSEAPNTSMSNAYEAYGPVPTSYGVIASPRVNGSLDRKHLYHHGQSCHDLREFPSNELHMVHGIHHGARHYDITLRPYVGNENVRRSYSDLRRSRIALEMTPEPLEIIEPKLNATGTTILRNSSENLGTPTPLDRRRNGSIYGYSGGCSVHGGYSRPPSRAGSRVGSRAHLELQDENRSCLTHSACCRVLLSVLTCLIILGGVIVALYFLIKCMY